MFSSIEHVTTDQNWTNGETVYWFDVDGELYGVVESGNDSTIVNSDGHPVDYNQYLLDNLEYVLTVTDEMRLDY